MSLLTRLLWSLLFLLILSAFVSLPGWEWVLAAATTVAVVVVSHPRK